MEVSKIILRALREVYDFDGYSVMQNGGIFNELNHYHYHVFPRFKYDGFSWTFGDNSLNDISDEGNKIKAAIDHLINDERQ